MRKNAEIEINEFAIVSENGESEYNGLKVT